MPSLLVDHFFHFVLIGSTNRVASCSSSHCYGCSYSGVGLPTAPRAPLVGLCVGVCVRVFHFTDGLNAEDKFLCVQKTRRAMSQKLSTQRIIGLTYITWFGESELFRVVVNGTRPPPFKSSLTKFLHVMVTNTLPDV